MRRPRSTFARPSRCRASSTAISPNALKALTGETWEIGSPDGPVEPTLLEQDQAREMAARDAILATPIVKAAFDAFPEAELLDYKAAVRG